MRHTQRKVVDYLRRRRSSALAAGDYTIEVQEGHGVELVTPEQPDGIRLAIAAHPTLWGRIEFALYVAPADGKHRRVAVVGRAGTTIIDDLAELAEAAADRMSDAVRRIFGLVLRELADLENPMRSAVGTEPGDGGLLEQPSALSPPGAGGRGDGTDDELSLPALPAPRDPVSPPSDDIASAKPERSRSSALPSVEPDPDPGEDRSRFDPDTGVVLYNDHHGDCSCACAATCLVGLLSSARRRRRRRRRSRRGSRS